ncbi:MAG: O-antigen ligase family protein [Candidatus Krumholzibacteriota bacterium]|nr:O-antigen ligase family protein [Candidatus Krumholzibacteriota bacterium]
MYHALDIASRRIFQGAFVLLALSIPFSIALMNIALGFAALAWALSSIASRIAPVGSRPVQPSIRRDPMLLASILLVVSAIPSVLLSENSSRAINDWSSYWQLLIYFAVASHMLATGMRETALRVLAISSILSCIVAFAQRAGGIELGFIHIAARHRVASTLYTMTFAGILAQLVVFYSAAGIAHGIARRERMFLFVAVLFQFTALLLTLTRGAWIAAAAGLAALCLLVRNRTVLLVGTTFFVLLVVFASLYSRDHDRTLSPAALFGSAPDRNVQTRLVLWDIAWDLFRENPLFGVGMGDYEAEATRLARDREIQTATDTHNIPLHILATRGLVGFIPFVYFWVTVVRVLTRVVRRTVRGTRAHYYALGGLAMVVALLTGALTENNIDDEEVFIAFMFLFGLARSEAYRPAITGGGEQAAGDG